MQPKVQVRGLSKRYVLGSKSSSTLKEAFENAWRGIVRKKNGLELLLAATQPSELWALRDVTFDVPSGEILGVIGKSGSGKSTLLKILSRITEPTRGSAIIRGRVSSLLEIGTGFHPDLTGRENIFLNGTMIGMRIREIHTKFDEIVNFAELEKFIDTPVKWYSSGMYVRLAFAIAAHLDSDVMIIDEALAVGDATFQQKCMRKSHAVASDGRTVLFVSHDMAAISQLCQRVLLLSHGSIAAVGSPQQVVPIYLA